MTDPDPGAAAHQHAAQEPTRSARVTCSVCGRSVAVRKDGLIRGHRGRDRTTCLGSHRSAAAAAAAAAPILDSDAAWNAVAAAAIGYQEARTTLRLACWHALTHGLTTADLAKASGCDPDCISNLIREP